MCRFGVDRCSFSVFDVLLSGGMLSQLLKLHKTRVSKLDINPIRISRICRDLGWVPNLSKFPGKSFAAKLYAASSGLNTWRKTTETKSSRIRSVLFDSSTKDFNFGSILISFHSRFCQIDPLIIFSRSNSMVHFSFSETVFKIFFEWQGGHSLNSTTCD